MSRFLHSYLYHLWLHFSEWSNHRTSLCAWPMRSTFHRNTCTSPRCHTLPICALLMTSNIVENTSIMNDLEVWLQDSISVKQGLHGLQYIVSNTLSNIVNKCQQYITKQLCNNLWSLTFDVIVAYANFDWLKLWVIEYCDQHIKLVWYFYSRFYCSVAIFDVVTTLLAIYCERLFTQQMILWTISTIYCL